MTEPLISVAVLAGRLVTFRPPVLLDVRWNLGGPPGIEAYNRGHLPAARFIDLDADLSAPPGQGRHPMPNSADFQAAMRRVGVNSGHPVVVYDGGDGLAAARAWWLLGYFGHAATQVLDGGYPAWTQAGRPVTTEVPTPSPGNFQADPGHLGLLDAAGAAALAERGILLDVRAPERFRGEHEPLDRVAGHIPGARNLPAAGNRRADGRFLDAADLRLRFQAAGVTEATEVGVYCGSGVTAAQQTFALAIAGISASVYVGSWSDWITDPSRAIATGEAE